MNDTNACFVLASCLRTEDVTLTASGGLLSNNPIVRMSDGDDDNSPAATAQQPGAFC